MTEYFQMDMDSINYSESPDAIDDHEISPKRQKIETSNSTAKIEECKHLKALLEILRARLSQTEASATHFHKLRREVDEIFLREKNELQEQVQAAEERIEQLQNHLETAVKNNHELHEALVATEAHMLEMKTEMERRIVALSIDNYTLRTTAITPNTSTEGLVLGDTSDKDALQAKFETAEKRILLLEQQLENNLAAQREFQQQTIELEQTKMIIEALDAANGQRSKLRSFSKSQNESNAQDTQVQQSKAKDHTLNTKKSKNEIVKSPAEAQRVEDSGRNLRSSTKRSGHLRKELSTSMIMKNSEATSDSQAKLEVLQPENSFLSGTEKISMKEEKLTFQVDDYIPGEFQVILFGDDSPNLNLCKDFQWIFPNDENFTNSEQRTSQVDLVRTISEREEDSEIQANDSALKECHLVLGKSNSRDPGARNNQGDQASNIDQMIESDQELAAIEGTALKKEEDKLSLQDDDCVPHEPQGISIENETANGGAENGSSSDDESENSDYEPEDNMKFNGKFSNLKLKVGTYFILVSSAKFFQINWSNEYKQLGPCQWYCKTCGHMEPRKFLVEEHVWGIHYGETFKCPHCPFHYKNNHFKSRACVRSHMKTKHI
uniref:Fhad1_3 protein n=1 Tax=Fopius arisanus TaxID=64838 RepID=A0A0C9RAI4_9HYME